MPVSSSVDRETGRIAAYAPLSREASDVMPTPAVRKTDVRTETQPNGSEVTTTIVEFTDPVGQLITRTQRTQKRHAGHTGCVWGGLLFQDHGIAAMSEVSYSTRQTVSPVSTNRVATLTPPSNTKSFPVCCFQVHVGSLSRESAGSPILVAENVTSATTHVTKVEGRAELRLAPFLSPTG